MTGEVAALPAVLAKLVPDTGSDVEPPEYTLVCQGEAEDGTVCGKQSPDFTDLAAVQDWACVHTMRHPDHRSFRMIADVPMLLVPQVEPQ